MGNHVEHMDTRMTHEQQLTDVPGSGMNSISPDPTVPESAAALRVTVPTIYKLLTRGELDSYKVGSKRRVTRASLLRKMMRLG
jgi:excisionase family DNA binding protein